MLQACETSGPSFGPRPAAAERLTEMNHRANWPRIYLTGGPRKLEFAQRLFGEGSPIAANFTCLA